MRKFGVDAASRDHKKFLRILKKGNYRSVLTEIQEAKGLSQI